MTTTRSTIPCLLSITMLILAGGCGDNHPLEPGGHADDGIVGHVYDADGNPLADVAIGLVYETVQPDPFAKPATGIDFVIPEAGMVRILVRDLTGETVRTLADSELPAGSHSISWDNRDESGRLAANGLYFMSVQFEGNLVAEASMLINNFGPATIHERANTVTDPEGYFRIPRGLIPVGEFLQVVEFEELVSRPISSLIKLETAGEIDGAPHYTYRFITLTAEMGRLMVDAVLPGTPVKN